MKFPILILARNESLPFDLVFFFFLLSLKFWKYSFMKMFDYYKIIIFPACGMSMLFCFIRLKIYILSTLCNNPLIARFSKALFIKTPVHLKWLQIFILFFCRYEFIRNISWILIIIYCLDKSTILRNTTLNNFLCRFESFKFYISSTFNFLPLIVESFRFVFSFLSKKKFYLFLFEHFKIFSFYQKNSIKKKKK